MSQDNKFAILKKDKVETHADKEKELHELKEKAAQLKKGGRPKKDDTEKLNVAIKLLFTQAEHDKLKAYCAEKGVSVNAVIRLAIGEYVK